MMKCNWFERGRSLRYAITFACQLAFILFGYDQGVFSGIVGNTDFLNTFGHPTSSLEGIIVSSYNLGAFTGCIINFFAAEKLGRRRAMWVAMAFIIVGAALQTSAFSVPHIIIARFVTGIGTSVETSTVPMYQSELCDADKRGRLVSSEPLFVGVGIEIAYWFYYGISFAGGPLAWRLPIACQMIFAFVVISTVFSLPESPRYLSKEGRNDEAVQVLCDIYDLPPEADKGQLERGQILEALEMEEEHGKFRWSQLFHVQTNRRILLAYGMQFMNQMGGIRGINLVVYYITSVFEYKVGLSRNLALLLGGVVNSMFVIGSLVPTFFLDQLGRRGPMMWGSLGLGISMLLIAVLLSFQNTSIGKQTSSASITFFFTYMLIFGASVNCIPWVYVPEILPRHSRAKGTAIGISANWLWNFFVVMITPTLIANLAWKGYLIFMALNFAFIPLVFFFYPETKNLTLEEMDYLFTPDPPNDLSVGAVGGEEPWKEMNMKSMGRRKAVMRSLNQDWRTTTRKRHSSVGFRENGKRGSRDREKDAEHAEHVV